MLNDSQIKDILDFITSDYSYVRPMSNIISTSVLDDNSISPANVSDMYVMLNKSTNTTIGLVSTSYGSSYRTHLQVVALPQGSYYDVDQDMIVQQNNYNLVSNSIERIISDNELMVLGNSIISSSMAFIKQFYPKLYRSLLMFKLVNDSSIDTLYVTYNAIIDKVELHYNPMFVAKGSLGELITNILNAGLRFDASQLTSADINSFVGVLGSFYFMHEVYHVLYRHVTDDSENNLPSFMENYVEDSYINSKLLKVYNNNPIVKRLLNKIGSPKLNISSGITDTYIISGNPRESLIKSATANDLDKYFNYSLRGEDELTQYFKNATINDQLIITCQNNNLDQTYQEFSDNTHKVINAIIDVDGENAKAQNTSAGAGPDNSQQSQQQGQSNQSQSSQQSSNNQSSQQQTDPTSTKNKIPDSTGDSGSDDNTTDNSGSTSGDNDSTDAAASPSGDDQSSNKSANSLSKSLSQNSTSGGSGSGLTQRTDTSIDNIKKIPAAIDKLLSDTAQEVSAELQKLDPSNDGSGQFSGTKLDKSLQSIISANKGSSSIAKSWRSKLKSMIEDATGIKVTYNPDAPNPRIEGQLGRENIETSLGDLILSFDISASMSVSDFKASLDYVADMMKMNLQFSRIGYSYWTSGHYEVAPRSISPSRVYTQALNNCPNESGGTPLSSMIQSFTEGKLRSCHPDLIIVFTDGEVWGSLSPKEKAWLMKNRRKILWVLKPGSSRGIQTLKRYDTTCEKRCVIMTDNSVAKNR